MDDDGAADGSSGSGGILGRPTDSADSEEGGTELGRRAMVGLIPALPGLNFEDVRSRFMEHRESRPAAMESALGGSIFNNFWLGGSEFSGFCRSDVLQKKLLLLGLIT